MRGLEITFTGRGHTNIQTHIRTSQLVKIDIFYKSQEEDCRIGTERRPAAPELKYLIDALIFCCSFYWTTYPFLPDVVQNLPRKNYLNNIMCGTLSGPENNQDSMQQIYIPWMIYISFITKRLCMFREISQNFPINFFSIYFF